MGMYTEIYVNVDLSKDTPEEVLEVLQAMSDRDWQSSVFDGRPSRWRGMFHSGSYYTPNTSTCSLTKDLCYSFIGKGDIKNYEEEIEKFFEFIEPWVEHPFMGYKRYEEFVEPTIMYSDRLLELWREDV